MSGVGGSEFCFMCTKRFRACKCGDWSVKTVFGREIVNPAWDVVAQRAANTPAHTPKRERKNGPVITRQRVRIGKRVA